MRKVALFRALIAALLLFYEHSFAQDVVIPILTNSGTLDGENYRCDQMVQSVNKLRHLGKDQALKVLNSHIKGDSYDLRIMCICRLLFINTNGWKPVEGFDYYREIVHTNILYRYPLFPIAISDGIPFFIYSGYIIDGGFVESAAEDLKLCKSCAMIPEDLPHDNYEMAAFKLVQSESFLKLFKFPKDMESEYQAGLIYSIRCQTGNTNLPDPWHENLAR